MKKLILLIALLSVSCTILDNSVRHQPIYMTDERYAHYAKGNNFEPAPWPY